MAALFAGLDRAYGVSIPTGKRDGRGKVSAKYETRRAPVTTDLWDRHLAGDHCLVPIPIRDDETAGFGAIDVDRYPIDLGALAKRVDELELPLVVCRSKSGGAHLFLFLREPYSAEAIQERLTDWAVALGYPGVEVFPKQTRLASENDVGNGIAAPYRGGATSLEYAVGPNDAAMTLDAFLDLAEARRVDGTDLPDVRAEVPDDLADAPPCLQHWARVGIGEGVRNDVLFDFGIYCKKRWSEDWQTRLEDMNRRYGSPPLPAAEILKIIGSVGKSKDYTYKSKCEGPYCNPRLCRKQQHGRGGGYDDPGVVIDGMTIVKTDPPTYIVTVNGKRIELTGSEWRDQRAFGARVEDALFVVYKPLKPKLWHELRTRLRDGADFEDAPEDTGARGQLIQQLDDFFAERASRERDKLQTEHCWHDVDNCRMYFRARDFGQFLKRRRVYGTKDREVFLAIRELGGGSSRIRAGKGNPILVWWVPRDPEPLPEPLPVPDAATQVEDADDPPF